MKQLSGSFGLQFLDPGALLTVETVLGLVAVADRGAVFRREWADLPFAVLLGEDAVLLPGLQAATIADAIINAATQRPRPANLLNMQYSPRKVGFAPASSSDAIAHSEAQCDT